MSAKIHPSSFRDPAGFIYKLDEQIFRFIAPVYAPHFKLLEDSGLLQELLNTSSILPFKEATIDKSPYPNAWKVLKPHKVSLWSYPYEWCFAQRKAAALLTLQLTLRALDKGMILKDASAFNIQFVNGKPVLIDHLSFERYQAGTAWVAFRQFCQHFLYPLLLESRIVSFEPGWLMQYPDGIPAAVVKDLLPARSKWSLLHYLYVHLPAKMAQKQSSTSDSSTRPLPLQAVKNNLNYLVRSVEKLQPATRKSHWSGYYSTTILNNEYLQHKEEMVDALLCKLKPATVTDLGCNTGTFSKIAAKYAGQVLAFDDDAQSINDLQEAVINGGIKNLLPIVGNLVSPAPALGWDNEEHSALLSRSTADVVMALALIHHLALSNNLPLSKIFELLTKLSKQYLIIEWVPKEDKMATILLTHREDIFDSYTEMDFLQAAEDSFLLIHKTALQGSSRMLYFFKRKP